MTHSPTVRPLPPGPIEHDDDGNAIPKLADNSDAADLIALLEYGRVKGFLLEGSIRVGKITIQTVRDLRRREGAAETALTSEGIWKEHGFDPEGDNDDV